jgi:uncharacterized Zn-binding protein involved in type VI secretion
MQISRRRFLSFIFLTGLLIPLNACGGFSDQMTLEMILEMIADYLDDQKKDDDSDTSGKVTLGITYPAGKSPSVFTSGWVFGARCSNDGQDISDQVKWSGTGSFSPETGNISRPVFSSEGANKITLSVTVAGKLYQKSVNVNAVSPAGFASVGSLAQCPSDAHGCPACPHSTYGPVTTGSSNVFVNGKRAARVGDVGVHAACCGPNRFEIVSGDPSVLINGKSAARMGSVTRHCGGTGSIFSL